MLFIRQSRFCGLSVCNQCSTHTMVDQRLCDICYLRQKSSNLIERKLNLLNFKDKTIKELERKRDEVGRELENTMNLTKEITENVNKQYFFFMFNFFFCE